MRVAAWAFVVLLAIPAVPAQSQIPLFAFEISAEPQILSVPAKTGQAMLIITVKDRSSDTPAIPGAPTVPLHSVTLDARPLETMRGWVVGTPTPVYHSLSPGDVKTSELTISRDTTVGQPFYEINITATFSAEDGSKHVRWMHVTAVTDGLTSFLVSGVGAATLAPRGFYEAEFEIRNLALAPQRFDVTVANNPCNFDIAVPSGVVVDGRQGSSGGVEVYSATFQAPDDKVFYLLGEQCAISLAVAPDGRPADAQRAFYTITIEGVQPTFEFVSTLILILLAILLIVLLARKAKRKIEARILQKPQPPWLIPVEALYLKALRQKDPRAYHVVRHHVMEEEHRSALLWFEAYRKATKGARQKQKLILKHEDAYNKWRAKWDKKIAKPIRKADKFEAKLQKKLDRKARKKTKKVVKSWKQACAKLEAKADAEHAKATKAHEKAAKKAAKRGAGPPSTPTRAAPTLPPEPQGVEIPLASHRWSKKAARFRRRGVKKQGNLEVKFEKKDARYLASLRRKVQKAARKLDDPDFVSEHPLLSS